MQAGEALSQSAHIGAGLKDELEVVLLKGGLANILHNDKNYILTISLSPSFLLAPM